MKKTQYSLNSFMTVLFVTLGIVLSATLSTVYAQNYPNTITFDNRSEEPATVKLVGPTDQTIEVPQGQERTVNVAAGEYYLLVRYGSDPGKYSYTKGDPFTVHQTAIQYSTITITLHKVVGGNYPTHPTSHEEFDKALGGTQKPDQPTVSQRKYSPMSVEEARQLVEKHIKNKDVPPPPSSSILGMSSWELPETSLYAQGIKINDNDYVIFAQGKSTILLYLPKGNLSEFLPKIPTSATDKDIVGPFYLNGIIFSTVDLEVVNNLTFRQGGGGWIRAKQVIEKGGYLWYIGAIGISVYERAGVLISFEEPITDFPSPSDRIIRIYEVALSISPKEHDGILVEVAGQAIQLK